jgi:hypothetical protein
MPRNAALRHHSRHASRGRTTRMRAWYQNCPQHVQHSPAAICRLRSDDYCCPDAKAGHCSDLLGYGSKHCLASCTHTHVRTQPSSAHTHSHTDKHSMQAHTVAAGANTEIIGLAPQLIHRTQQVPQAQPRNDPHKPTVNKHAKHSVPQHSYQMGPQLQQTIAFPHYAGVSILQPVSAANAATSSDRGEQSGKMPGSLCAGNSVHREWCAHKLHTAGVAGGNSHGALVSFRLLCLQCAKAATATPQYGAMLAPPQMGLSARAIEHSLLAARSQQLD